MQTQFPLLHCHVKTCIRRAPTACSRPVLMVLPEVHETMLFLLLFEHREASSKGRNSKAATQMLLLRCGRQSLLSLLSLKLENNLSDLCTEQHYVSFHCVRTFLLLKMLHLTEQLVLKAAMFCFSSM